MSNKIKDEAVKIVEEKVLEVAEKAVEVLESKVIEPLKGRLQEDRNAPRG